MESRFRRVQQSVPLTGRGLPGMPLEMEDADGDEKPRFDRPRNPWWRPAGSMGRVLLGLGALIVLSGFAFSIHQCTKFLERDARFRVAGTGNIQATGLSEVRRSDMLPIFGEDIGRNIFFVPLAQRRNQLEQIPWVERATVMRVLPDQIRVAVVERQPVAFVRHGQQIGLVDASGVLLTMPAAMMAQHRYSFPVLTGIDARDPMASRQARMAVYLRLLGELDVNGQHLSDQISEIDLTDPEDARVLMPEQGGDILAHFGEDRFLDRYQRYKAHIAEWRQQYPKLAAVDLRYDQQVVLEMAPGAGADQTATSDGGGKPAAGEPVKTQAKAAATQTSTPKHAASSKPAKTHASPHAGSHTNSHASLTASAAAKARAAKAREKKRAAARRAALNQHRQKNASTTRPAAVAGQGQ
ncbi:MAG: FtsQ-type POTRA domain-containing protein [Acidobacteriota bacterium]|nr:FtsQ-type POTRA domain-containing protein [Acidobacteriota bacterium]